MGRKNRRFCSKTPFLKAGLSLTETIVVVAILGILIVLAFLTLKPSLQLARSRDGRRKADLKKISTAVEDYAGDHPCYPVNVYKGDGTCRPSDEFAAYLNPIPCDPLTKKPYVYRLIDSCKEYAIFATLELGENISYGADTGNYVVSNTRLEPSPITTTPAGGGTATTPTSSVEAHYGCFGGICMPISDTNNCPSNYDRPDCYGECGTPENPQHDCNTLP